jgi:hypothetical protein
MATSIYRAEMGAPPANTKDGESAPGPMTKKQRTGKTVIGKPANLTPAERAKIERDMTMASDPVPGEKKFSSGGYTKAADGCCKKGKTRGKMV